jgi:hypothetical protein
VNNYEPASSGCESNSQNRSTLPQISIATNWQLHFENENTLLANGKWHFG